MGRKEHLEVTLPLMLKTFDRVIVVDWSCPQNTGAWAAQEGASVIYKYGEKFFERTSAKNLGFTLVQSEYVAFIDADSWCFQGMRDDLLSLLSPQIMVVAARNAKGLDLTDTFGFIACRSSAFRAVGGYDESFKGWGHEDSKLRGQLLLEAGLSVARLKPDSLGAIRHGNDVRGKYNDGDIFATATPNWKKLYQYFEQFGIKDWMLDPRTESITFKCQTTTK